jgi:hypothetical protein
MTSERDERRLPPVLKVVNDKRSRIWLAEEPSESGGGTPPPGPPQRPYFEGDSRQDIARKLTYAGYKASIRNRWERLPGK